MLVLGLTLQTGFFRASMVIKLCLRQSRESPLLGSWLLMVGKKLYKLKPGLLLGQLKEFLANSRKHCKTYKQCWW